MIDTFTVELPHGVSLSCRAAGAPGAPLLVLLHGFPEAAFVWDPVIELLADRFRCVAPNLRGYEKSSAPHEVEAYRAKHLVRDITALIEQFGGQASAVVAHDWGGAVAWNLAAQQPQFLRRLVIINSPHPATFLRELKLNPLQQAASAYMNFLIRPDAEQLLAENDFARLWRFFEGLGASDAPAPIAWLDAATRQKYRAIWSQGLSGPLNFYRASPLRPPTAEDASILQLQIPDEAVKVRLPTLVIWGEADRALLPSLLDGLEGFVPDMRIERMAQASHWVIHEQPQRIAALIGEFAVD
nr:putative hpoxide hydrolase [uncultured bacterium]